MSVRALPLVSITAQHFSAGAIVFGIIALFSVLSYFGFRSRIPFAALLLQVVVDVSKHHKSVYAVAFIGLLIQSALNMYRTTLRQTFMN